MSVLSRAIRANTMEHKATTSDSRHSGYLGSDTYTIDTHIVHTIAL